jgi:peptidoglycan/xylan/chitin deacetylase (PgdA/CDA1 family)
MDLRISIDDGSPEDLRVIKILKKNNLIENTTVYYCPFYRKDNLDEEALLLEIKETGVRIGSHTLTHKTLSNIPDERKIKEILGGIEWLRQMGVDTDCFAYPKGWFNEDSKRVLALCGVKEARTMKQGISDITNYDSLEIPITEHFYPNKIDIKKLDELLKKNYYHLALHGWEIEKFGLWEQLYYYLEKIGENKNSRG